MRNLALINHGRGRGPVAASLLGGVLAALLSAGHVYATPPSFVAPAEGSTTNTAAGPFGFLTGISRSGYMLGDMWGLRPWLSQYGVSLNILETSEVLGNVSGGVHQGADYDGLTQMILQLDTQRAFHWYGGTFNISGLQIHGRNLSADNLDTLQTASGIEGDRSTRLWELWYQQKFLEEDRLDVKIGEQSLDQEFMVSQNALLFVNTMFGWPMLPSADLPGGGPAYPLAAPGLRFRWRPVDAITILAGVFNGSPVSNNSGDPQQQNPSGTSFPLNGGALAIAEVQFAYPALGTMVYADQSEALSRVYKLGVWYDTENFADQEYADETHQGDYAIYAVMDQMIWSDPNDPDGDRTISFFTRAMGTPETDRNLIDFSLNAGFNFHEPIPHRGDDTFGIGMGFAQVSDRAADADRDNGLPMQGGETFVEATYQYQLTPWCQVQPDFQYVFNPGGGILNPNAPGQKVKDEAVIGMRLNILF
jgi:porin